MKVSFFERRPQKSYFSIEGIFHTIKQSLPAFITVNTVASRYYSIGLINRIRIGLEARTKQGDVNHITGDINFLALFLNRRKTILTIHDCGNVRDKTGLRHFVLWFFWYYLPLKKLKYITVISSETKQELLKTIKIDPDKINIIYNCIQPIFKPCLKEFNKLCPVILQIGTARNKNLERLIPALENIPCRLVIIGAIGSSIVNLLKVNRIEYSTKTGLSTEEIYEQYCHADIVTFVSTYEGFGLPIVEANATGRPVITSDVSCMPEVAGNSALLINPDSISSIRQGILKLIDDENLRSRLIQSGFENVKRFESKKIAQEYARLYQEVFSKS